MYIESSPLGKIDMTYPHLSDLCSHASMRYHLEKSQHGVRYVRWSVVPNYVDGKRTIEKYLRFEAAFNLIRWRLEKKHKHEGMAPATTSAILDFMLKKTQAVKLEDGSSIAISLSDIAGLDRYVEIHNTLSQLGVTGYDYREPREVKQERIKLAKSGMSSQARLNNLAKEWQ